MRQVLRHIARFAAATLMAALFSMVSHAQEAPIRFKIYNEAENNAPFDNVRLWIFGSEREGQQAYMAWKEIKKDEVLGAVFEPEGYLLYLDLAGRGADYQTEDYYSTLGSALIISNVSPYVEKFISFKGKEEFKVALNISHTIEESLVVGKGKGVTRRQPPEDEGDTLDLKFLPYIFPEEMRLGRSDGRFVMQTFLAPIPEDYDDRDEGAESTITDTLEWRKVIVMDGLDYHKTQYRRMGYLPLDQMGEADTLYVIAQNTPILTEETKEAGCYDKLYKTQQVKDGVLVMGQIWFEDYNHVYHEDLVELSDTRRTNKPMQFLEYDSTPQELDPYSKYHIKNPKTESFDGSMDLNIQFEQGSSRVNPNDVQSMKMLDSLKNTFAQVFRIKGSWIREYSISGVSSPEGGYATNVSLAKERMYYINNQIKSQFPENRASGLRKDPDITSRVATWTEMADTLSALGYPDEASQIRAIVAAHPGNNDAQNPFIYKLPFYDTIIKANLGRLRVVKVDWVQQIRRKKTDQEVLDDFYKDPENKDITEYELWVLLQKLTKPEELEPVCRLAIEKDSYHKEKEHWLLPPNVLAGSYIRRGVVDTTILAPLIDETRRCNFPWNPYGMGNDKPSFILNPPELIVNQILMMLNGDYIGRAVDLAEMINTPEIMREHPEYEFLYAVVSCKGGYRKASDQYKNVLRNSTPRNKIIMDMAAGYFDLAIDELEEMDQDDPLIMYLKAQIACRKFYDDSNEKYDFNLMSTEAQDNAVRSLSDCFKKDPKYLEIAKRDWFIFKGLLKKAKKEYEEPGSVLRIQVADPGLSEAEKKALLRKGANHFEELTEEEQSLYLDLISQ